MVDQTFLNFDPREDVEMHHVAVWDFASQEIAPLAYEADMAKACDKKQTLWKDAGGAILYIAEIATQMALEAF